MSAPSGFWQVMATFTRLEGLSNDPAKTRWSYVFGGLIWVGDAAAMPTTPLPFSFRHPPLWHASQFWSPTSVAYTAIAPPTGHDARWSTLDGMLGTQWQELLDAWSNYRADRPAATAAWPIEVVASGEEVGTDLTTQSADDRPGTWSSVLAGLALKGPAIGHTLSLAGWFDVDKAIDLSASPIIPRYPNFEPPPKPPTQPARTGIDYQEWEYEFIASEDGVPHRVRFRIRVHSLGGQVLLPKRSGLVLHDDDWRLNLRHRLGRELDLLALLDSAEPDRALSLAFDRLSCCRAPCRPGPSAVTGCERVLRLVVPIEHLDELPKLVTRLKSPDFADWKRRLFERLGGEAEGSFAQNLLLLLKRPAASDQLPRLLQDLQRDGQFVLELWVDDLWQNLAALDRCQLLEWTQCDDTVDLVAAIRGALTARQRMLPDVLDEALVDAVWPDVARVIAGEQEAASEPDDAKIVARAVWTAFDRLAELKTEGDSGLLPATGMVPAIPREMPEIVRRILNQPEMGVARVTAPHPLLVPIPRNAEAEGSEVQGALVFARRVEKGKPFPWECLTLCDVNVIAYPPPAVPVTLVARGVPVPVPLSTADGIAQDIIRYSGHPLGIAPLQLDPDRARDAKRPHAFLHLDELRDLWNHWAGVPQLRYGPDTIYDFYFVPMHLSGALHPRYCTADGLLRAQGEFGADEKAVYHAKPYLRRVPVGRPRLAVTTDTEFTLPIGLYSHGETLRVPGEFVPAPPPEGVTPLAADLPVRRVSQTDIPQQSRPDLLLLSDELESVVVSVLPPSTDLENWRRWVEPLEDADERSNIIAAIEDARCLQHVVSETEQGGERYRRLASQLFDDPAVVAIEVALFDPVDEIEIHRERLDIPFANLATCDGSSQSLLNETRHRAVYPLSGAPSRLRVERSGGVPRLTFEGSDLVVTVPAGGLYDLKFIPVIGETERFDEIYVFPPSRPPRFAIDSAAYSLRVESAPHADAILGECEDLLWRGLKLHLPRLESDRKPGDGRDDFRLRATLDPTVFPAKLRPWLGWVRIELQWWRWNGLPQDGEFLAAAAATDADDENLAAIEQGEISGFALRDDRDVDLNEVPLNLVSGPLEPVEIFRAVGALPVAPSYVRAKITVFTRYARPLRPGGAAAGLAAFVPVSATSAHIWNGDMQTPWRRAIVPGRLSAQSRLLPPRVKMVLPVMVPELNAQRPGILVITRDTLASPFHHLRAKVQVAVLDQRLATAGAATGEIEYPEIGPDGATTGRALVENSGWHVDESVGTPFGLTFEPSAKDPLFPHSGFHFDFPAIRDGHGTVVSPTDFSNNDFFAKLEFRWEIAPPRVMSSDTPAQWLSGPATQGWQVQFLAGFDRVTNAGDPGECIRIPDLVACFSPHGDLSFARQGREDEPLDTVAIRPADNPSNSEKGLHTVLMFVVWRTVPDFLVAEGTPRAEWLFEQIKGEWRPIIRGQLPTRQLEPGEFHGRLLLCRFPCKPVDQKIDATLFGMNAATAPLAGVPTDEPDGMIVRSSETIPCRSTP